MNLFSGRTEKSLLFSEEQQVAISTPEKHSLKRKLACEVAANFVRMAGRRYGRRKLTKKALVLPATILSEKAAIPKLFSSDNFEWFNPEIHGWPVATPSNDVLSFLTSKVPVRFLFLQDGEWRDFPANAANQMRVDFVARNSCIRLQIHDHPYLVNFVQMMLMSLQTGSLRSIAWIDKLGKCFFPSRSFEGDDGAFFLSQLQEKRAAKENSAALSSSHASNVGSTYNHSSAEAESNPKTSNSFSNNLVRLDSNGAEFPAIKSKFLSGMGAISSFASVLNICQIVNSKDRIRAFRAQREETTKKRGNANVLFAWHGISKEGMSLIANHGFEQPSKRTAAFGTGIYLSPLKSSCTSALFSDIDEEGVQHMILCQMIGGSMELLTPTGKDPPSINTSQYDTGVDDLSNPKLHIVSSSHANTHILPLYIVSFKVSGPWREVLGAVSRGVHIQKRCRITPASSYSHHDPCMDINENEEECSCPSELLQKGGAEEGSPPLQFSSRMSFSRLVYTLRESLPSSKIIALQGCLQDFQAGQVTSEALIAAFRGAVGDTLLYHSIRRLQAMNKPICLHKVKPSGI